MLPGDYSRDLTPAEIDVIGAVCAQLEWRKEGLNDGLAPLDVDHVAGGLQHLGQPPGQVPVDEPVLVATRQHAQDLVVHQ